MTAPLKKLYALRLDKSKVSFVHSSVEYDLETPDSKVAQAFPYLQTNIPLSIIEKITGVSEDDLTLLKQSLHDENLIQEHPQDAISGKEFFEHFRNALPDLMYEAFSSPYWEIMLSGKGSLALYAGYLLELYHYTKNANRHMPLAVAHCPQSWKSVKRLLAVHYFEEWDHFDFFADALMALGVSKEEIEHSDPLPSTLEMSNFMRQAARTSPLCYAICSGILEGSTEDSDSYGKFFQRIAPLYNIPEGAIAPIYDHLALDAKYDHKSLFGQICEHFPEIPAYEAERTISFAHQMVDHIYMWTEHIHRYYGASNTVRVRRKFDLNRD